MTDGVSRQMYILSLLIYRSKVRPRTGHEDPGGELRHSSTLSLTSALDGVGGQRHFPAAIPPGNRSSTHFIGWVGPRAGWAGVKNLAPTGIRSLGHPSP